MHTGIQTRNTKFVLAVDVTLPDGVGSCIIGSFSTVNDSHKLRGKLQPFGVLIFRVRNYQLMPGQVSPGWPCLQALSTEVAELRTLSKFSSLQGQPLSAGTNAGLFFVISCLFLPSELPAAANRVRSIFKLLLVVTVLGSWRLITYFFAVLVQNLRFLVFSKHARAKPYVKIVMKSSGSQVALTK